MNSIPLPNLYNGWTWPFDPATLACYFMKNDFVFRRFKDLFLWTMIRFHHFANCWIVEVVFHRGLSGRPVLPNTHPS